MIILIHSSKTMRANVENHPHTTEPQLLGKATILHNWLAQKTVHELMIIMKISRKLAVQTKEKIDVWSQTTQVMPALDCFVGDIYSGLQANTMSKDDRQYAQKHLRILSGLYGILRPLDGIKPYRFEMGYKTPGLEVKNVYDFWGETIAATLPSDRPIVNVSSDEYMKAVLPYLTGEMVITPRFLTYDKKKQKPVFIVVHAKIARGAFAGWIIRNRISDTKQLMKFSELGYTYDPIESTETEPVFICREFQGLGLSIRLN